MPSAPLLAALVLSILASGCVTVYRVDTPGSTGGTRVRYVATLGAERIERAPARPRVARSSHARRAATSASPASARTPERATASARRPARTAPRRSEPTNGSTRARVVPQRRLVKRSDATAKRDSRKDPGVQRRRAPRARAELEVAPSPRHSRSATTRRAPTDRRLVLPEHSRSATTRRAPTDRRLVLPERNHMNRHSGDSGARAARTNRAGQRDTTRAPRQLPAQRTGVHRPDQGDSSPLRFHKPEPIRTDKRRLGREPAPHH